jgi:hypothetical protein
MESSLRVISGGLLWDGTENPPVAEAVVLIQGARILRGRQAVEADEKCTLI